MSANSASEICAGCNLIEQQLLLYCNMQGGGSQLFSLKVNWKGAEEENKDYIKSVPITEAKAQVCFLFLTCPTELGE